MPKQALVVVPTDGARRLLSTTKRFLCGSKVRNVQSSIVKIFIYLFIYGEKKYSIGEELCINVTAVSTKSIISMRNN